MTDQVELIDEAEPLKPLPAVPEEDQAPRIVPSPLRTLQRRWLADRPRAVDAIGLAVLALVAAFLWGRAAGMAFWLDEGISVGVAAHPLHSIPHLLLQDGSPPLYYLLLHLWISVTGSSDTAVHLLSLLFGVATVPAALWAGWSLFDRRTGWICALVVAVNPFVAYYATETRMYSMAILLAVLATATFLHVYVFGRRRYLPWFALSLAALLYTHNWGLLLGLGAGVALLALLVLSRDRRRLVVDGVIGFGGVAVLYAPWAPSLAYQMGQHLQPWGRKADLVWVRDDLAVMLGGNEVFVALGLGVGVGIAAMVQSRGWTRQALGVLALGVITVVTLALGWRGSVWAYRYLAVVAAPVMLLVGVGLARAGRTGVAALAVAAFLAGPVAVRGPAYQKSNVEAVASEVSARLRPGDLVVLPDFQMVPLAAHYLPSGLRYSTTSGLVPDRNIVDWRHVIDRLVNDDPATTLPPLLDTLPPGAHVLFMCPPPGEETAGTGLAQAQSIEKRGSAATAVTGDQGLLAKTVPLPQDVAMRPLISVRCQQASDLLTKRPGLEVQEILQPPDGVRYTSVDAWMFIKR